MHKYWYRTCTSAGHVSCAARTYFHYSIILYIFYHHINCWYWLRRGHARHGHHRCCCHCSTSTVARARKGGQEEEGEEEERENEKGKEERHLQQSIAYACVTLTLILCAH